MNKIIDMHIHTNASDGTYTPQEVARETKKRGISIFSITDHDSIKSVSAGMELARAQEQVCVAGMEATSTYEGREFHILGYGLNLSDGGLLDFINNTAIIRYERELTIVRQAQKHFPDVSMGEFHAYAKLEKAGGFPSLNYLQWKGKVAGLKEFGALMRELELSAGPSFSPAEDVIAMLKGAGGVVVLAHPSYHYRGTVMEEPLLDTFRELGIDGVECYSPYNMQKEQTAYYAAYCEKYKLAVSGGSDCHGPYLPREIGVPRVDERLCTITQLLGIG